MTMVEPSGFNPTRKHGVCAGPQARPMIMQPVLRPAPMIRRELRNA